MTNTRKKAQPIPPAQQVQNDVDRLVNAQQSAKTVDLGQYSFTVYPLKVRQLFPFLQLVRPLFAALSAPRGPDLPPTTPVVGQGGDVDPAEQQLPANVQSVLTDVDYMVDMISEHGPTILKAMACGLDSTGKAEAQRQLVEQMEDLELADLLVLVRHFVQVNAGFFVARGLTLDPGKMLGGLAPSVTAEM